MSVGTSSIKVDYLVNKETLMVIKHLWAFIFTWVINTEVHCIISTLISFSTFEFLTKCLNKARVTEQIAKRRD